MAGAAGYFLWEFPGAVCNKIQGRVCHDFSLLFLCNISREFPRKCIFFKFPPIDTEELKTIDDINNYFDKVINHLKENENFYSMFLSSNEPLLFTQRLSKIMDKKLDSYFRLKQQPDVSLSMTFFIDGCINLVIKYFKKNIDTNLDEINKCIKNLFLKIFYN